MAISVRDHASRSMDVSSGAGRSPQEQEGGQEREAWCDLRTDKRSHHKQGGGGAHAATKATKVLQVHRAADLLVLAPQAREVGGQERVGLRGEPAPPRVALPGVSLPNKSRQPTQWDKVGS